MDGPVTDPTPLPPTTIPTPPAVDPNSSLALLISGIVVVVIVSIVGYVLWRRRAH